MGVVYSFFFFVRTEQKKNSLMQHCLHDVKLVKMSNRSEGRGTLANKSTNTTFFSLFLLESILLNSVVRFPQNKFNYLFFLSLTTSCLTRRATPGSPTSTWPQGPMTRVRGGGEIVGNFLATLYSTQITKNRPFIKALWEGIRSRTVQNTTYNKVFGAINKVQNFYKIFVRKKMTTKRYPFSLIRAKNVPSGHLFLTRVRDKNGTFKKEKNWPKYFYTFLGSKNGQ